MTAIEKQIVNKMHSLPNFYLQEILDFIEFLSSKYKKNSDTEYLENIQGMTESIERGRKENIEDCKTMNDIGWNNGSNYLNK